MRKALPVAMLVVFGGGRMLCAQHGARPRAGSMPMGAMQQPGYRGPGAYGYGAPSSRAQAGSPGYSARPGTRQPYVPGSTAQSRGALASSPGGSATAQTASPPGHLGSWLSQHGNMAPQDQERALRADPGFTRLPQTEQRRLLDQLHQVDNLNQQQRERRLARAEMIERLSPQERMSLNRSNQAYSMLAPDRQAMVKQAFRDLRTVPADQRATVLNSARYRGAFSSEERGILSDFLRIEPYTPGR